MANDGAFLPGGLAVTHPVRRTKAARKGWVGKSTTYGLQKVRALEVHLPKPTATMLAMTRQT